MKRFLCLILVAFMLFFTAACNQNPVDDDKDNKQTSVSTTESEVTTTAQTTAAEVVEISYDEAYDKIYNYLLKNGSRNEYKLDAELRRNNGLPRCSYLRCNPW